MNPIAEEIKSYLGSAQLTDEEFLEHYGIKRKSGRYPYGSGEDPYQHESWYHTDHQFLNRIEELKKKGWKETPENIKKEFNMSTTQYIREKRLANTLSKMEKLDRVNDLKSKGLNDTQIGKIMGVNESTVRGWTKQYEDGKILKTKNLAESIKKLVDEKGMIDVGVNAERELNVSRERLDTALLMLEKEGYVRLGSRVSQQRNGQMTTLNIIAPPGTEKKAAYDFDKIHPIKEYISRDGGETLEKKFHYPSSLDSKRIKVLYKDEKGLDGYTGEDKDGVIEIRRGVADLDLKGSRYSQVRILVDGTHYLKGMAVYSDKMPDGVDVVFNTNKPRGTPKLDTFKKIHDDPENPFGSNIKDVELGGQYWYTDPKTGKKKLGLINKRADEGDWTEWSDGLPSQFLSKQSKALAKKQLDLARDNKQAEYDEICELNNPTIKKYYLKKFADGCDKAAVDLKAASLPGQKYHVIIPINAMGDDKIYAPKYEDGTKLALVRYPHGGIFEIPVLTVDNKNKVARRLLPPDVDDAVGISKKIADQLSGADFDGDTVMCIPTHDKAGRTKISYQDPLPALKGFDPKLKYGPDPGSEFVDKNGDKWYTRNGIKYKGMNDAYKQNQMGVVSNLITDMTLLGANNDKIARAVKHSMVVIDAEKHHLDYKASYRDNDIDSLQKEYQVKARDEYGNITKYKGASTIISRAKGKYPVDKRRGQAYINIKGKEYYDPSKPEGTLIYKTAYDKDLYYAASKTDKNTGLRTMTLVDGKKITYNPKNKTEYNRYTPIMMKNEKTGEVYFTSKDGKLRYKTEKRTYDSTNMAETTNAYTLISKKRNPMEFIYADYANSMKAMANKARIEMIQTKNLKYSPDAKKAYAKEVSNLNAQLNEAMKNSNRERLVTRMVAADIKKKKQENPNLTPSEESKLAQRYAEKYRKEVGSIKRKDRNIKISDREWEAIQAGAISNHKLELILQNSDPDILRERAMPSKGRKLTSAQIARIVAMKNNGQFTLQQIANKLNISVSAVSNALKGGK